MTMYTYNVLYQQFPASQHPTGKTYKHHFRTYSQRAQFDLPKLMGAGTGGAGWASAHPEKNQGGHGPPWKF